MHDTSCPACDVAMRPARHDWLSRCPECGFLASTLAPYAEERDATSTIDEGRRMTALTDLRHRNFAMVLEQLRASGDSATGSLLDVGCAHGWFLDAAAAAGYAVAGIEPDAAMHAIAAARHPAVVRGFFPDDIPAGTLFDVIVFNDVLEHLPRVDDMVAACRRLLRPGGRLVVNIPSSRGVLYRLGNLLDACGVHGPFDRLWQRRFPSPHLSYFHPDALHALARRHGFREVTRRSLQAMQLRGLWQRLRYDRTASLPASIMAYAVLAPAVPVVRLLPADTVVQVFRLAEA